MWTINTRVADEVARFRMSMRTNTSTPNNLRGALWVPLRVTHDSSRGRVLDMRFRTLMFVTIQ